MAIGFDDLVRALELWLKLNKKPNQTGANVNTDLDPVLLVPGIGGSILHAVNIDDDSYERVWVRFVAAEYKLKTKLWSRYDPSTVQWMHQYFMLKNLVQENSKSGRFKIYGDLFLKLGKTESMDPKTTIAVPEDRHGLYAIDILDPDLVIGSESVYYFHDMIVEMLKWGYQEGTTLFGFGYDFRQSNRLPETMDKLAAKLAAVYNAAGGKKINIITHSMGGILVKCFMALHTDIFEKYVKNWIAVCAPFQGAPGCTNSTFLNGMSFVEGWEQRLYISKWSMHQLLMECPSIYELMGPRNFNWQVVPRLELFREHDSDGNSRIILESYTPSDNVGVLKEALATNTINYNGLDLPLPFNSDILKWANETWEILSSAKLPSGVKFYNIYGTNLATSHTVCYGSQDKPVTDLEQLRYFEAKYICVDGDGTVPVESAKADGLNAEARVGIPGEHRGILCEPHLFRIIKHWLRAGDPDPFYDPLNDYVILPTAFEMESHKEKGVEVASLKEEWDVISKDHDEQSNSDDKMEMRSISVSHDGTKAHATVTVREGKQHVELKAVTVSVDA